MNKSNLGSVNQRKLAIILLLFVALLGVILTLFVSRFGLGATGDSVHYLMGAQNILAGEGFGRSAADGTVRPITMLPPFFSFVMAGIGLTGAQILEGTRILNAFLFGASIGIVGLLIHRHTNSIWASLTGAVMILVAEDVVRFNAWLMPEALYIFLMLLTIYFLSSYLESNKTSSLILMSVVAGLATLTRFFGFSLVGTGVVSILVFGKTSWRKRLVDSIAFGLISLGGIGLWMIRNTIVAGSLANREFGFHPVTSDLFQAYRAEISFWFVPRQLGLQHTLRRAIMFLMAIVGPAVYFVLEFREKFLQKRMEREGTWTLPWILAIYAVAYIGSLFLNLTFIDAVIDFNVIPRYLAPLLVIFIVLFVVVYQGLSVKIKRWWIPRALVSILAIGLIALYAQNTLSLIMDPNPSLGYTGLKLERPDTLAMLDTLSRSKPIISNDPEMVYAFSSRPAYMLPIQFDFNTRKERDDFDKQLAATRDKLELGGILVIFHPINQKEMEVIMQLEAELINSFQGSSFYAYPQSFLE